MKVTTAFTDCRGVSGFGIITLDTIPTFRSGDTMWILISRRTNFCNLGCGSNSRTVYRRLFQGLGLSGTYSNTCGKTSITLPQRELFGVGDIGANVVYTGPVSIGCSGKISLRYTGTASYWFVGNVGGRVHNDFEVVLPAGLMLDTISGVTAFIRNNGTDFLPIARPGPNIFRFNRPVLSMAGAILTIHIRQDTAVKNCSGTKVVSLYSRVNPDTARTCNTSFDFFCIQHNMQLYACSSCCTEGLEIRDLNAVRKNLDIRDPLNNGVAAAGRPDSTLTDRCSYMIGDTLVLTSLATAKTSVGNPRFEYAYFKAGLPGGSSNWVHMNTTVKHFGPSNPLSTINPTPTFSGDSVRWDLSALPDILDDDTLMIQSYFRVRYIAFEKPDIIATNETRWYVSRVPNPLITQQLGISCGRSEINTILTGYSTSTGSTTSVSLSGCSQVVVTGGIRYISTLAWPFEIRPNAYPVRIAYRVPAGWKVDSVNLPRASASGKDYSTVWSMPYTIAGDSLILNVRSLFAPAGGRLPVFADREEFAYRIYMKPTCTVPSTRITSGSTYSYINVRDTAANQVFSVVRSNLQATMAEFVISSSNTTALAYESAAVWPVRITNTTAISAPNSFVYLRSPGGRITIDSVRSGTSRLTAVNGFYQLGNIAGGAAVNLTIFARTSACDLDTLQVHVGFDCNAYPTSFTNDICGSPKLLFVQPQPAELQTQVSTLANTPASPSNPGAGNYGSNTIPDICAEVPVEILIASTQPGTLYDVRELIRIPAAGAKAGLSFVSGSGYIEYPLGTTPRAFSTAANASLSVTGATQWLLSLNQIDSVNFNAVRGLQGT